MSAMFRPHVGKITVLMSYWGFNESINSFSTGGWSSKECGLYIFMGAFVLQLHAFFSTQFHTTH